MPLAQSHCTTFQEQLHPNKHTVSDPVYSHPAAIRVEVLERFRATSGPCPEGSNNRKIGTAKDSPAILTACKTPRLVVCRDGQARYVGCHRAGCQECRSERDRKLFRRVAVELKRRKADVVYIMARFGQAAQSRFTALPDAVVRSAMLGALKAVRRARKGGRGRPAWPGCSLEYVRAVGVNDGGILDGVQHHHLVIKLSALPGSELPSLNELKGELLFYYCRALAKGLPTKEVAEQTFPPDMKQGNLIYFEPCRDKIAAARYILCQQEGTFLPGFRRRGMSRRFFSQKGTETMDKGKNDVVDSKSEQMFPRAGTAGPAPEPLSQAEAEQLRPVNAAGVHVPSEQAASQQVPSQAEGEQVPVKVPDPTWQERLARENVMADTDHANRELERAVVKPLSGTLISLAGAVAPVPAVSVNLSETASEDTHGAAQEVARLRSRLAELEAQKGNSKGSLRSQVEDDIDTARDQLKRANHHFLQCRVADVQAMADKASEQWQEVQAKAEQAVKERDAVEWRRRDVLEEMRQLRIDLRVSGLALPTS